jgi:hypothetical protein
MRRESLTEIWDTEAIQQEATLYCASTDSVYSSSKAENEGGLPYIPLQAGHRSKKQSLTHIMLACNFIGYFTPPSAM